MTSLSASFHQNVRDGLARAGVAPGSVLVAVSGGADSVALLVAMRELSREDAWQVHAAHLNHQLRGDDSERDADWIAARCREWEIDLSLETVDIAGVKAISGKGIEESARHIRYEFLNRIARRGGIGTILVAHTADDQTETILHHVLRGTGLAGLSGIPRSRPVDEKLAIARPLLDITRHEIEAYLAERGVDYCVDASNTDRQFTRNRIRHDLLPLLRSQYNANVDDALRRLGQHAADMQNWIASEACQLLDQALLVSSDDDVVLDRRRLAAKAVPLLRESFSQLWSRQDWPRQRMSFAQWQRLAESVSGRTDGDYPGGITARVSRTEFRLSRSTAD